MLDTQIAYSQRPAAAAAAFYTETHDKASATAEFPHTLA